MGLFVRHLKSGGPLIICTTLKRASLDQNDCFRRTGQAHLSREDGNPLMNELHRPPQGEIEMRIQRLQEKMTTRGIHGILITQRIDLLYFSGCAQNAYLYVPQKGVPILLVRKHLPRAALDSPLPVLVGLDSIREIPKLVVERGCPAPDVMGMTWDVMPVREFDFFRGLFASRANVDVSDLVRGLRSIKSPWENEQISLSSRVCEMTLEHLRSIVRPRMEENHLAGLSEAFARHHGHGGGIRVRYPTQDNRSGWLGGEQGLVPDSGPFTVGFRSVVNGYHAARARVFLLEPGHDSDQYAVESLEAFHGTLLENSARSKTVTDIVFEARRISSNLKSDRPAAEFQWTLQGIGLELWEPAEISESAGRSGAESACVVLESRTLTEDGRAISLQDTLSIDSEGVRLQ